MWLDRNLKGVERINVSSTSRAARMLKDDPKAASISNRICADIYHTRVIAENIQDTQSLSSLQSLHTIPPSLASFSSFRLCPITSPLFRSPLTFPVRKLTLEKTQLVSSSSQPVHPPPP